MGAKVPMYVTKRNIRDAVFPTFVGFPTFREKWNFCKESCKSFQILFF